MPTTTPLETSIRTLPGVALIDLRGEIDSFSTAALDAAYLEASRTSPGTLVLNFERVDYINSTGIALIVNLLSKARGANQNLLVYGLSDHYIEIFEITRLSDFIGIFPDEVSALAGSVS